MASIEARTRNGRRVWLVRYLDPEGHDRAPSFRTRTEAVRARAKIEQDPAEDTYVTDNTMTVAEYALDTYLPNRPHNANSHEHVRSMIANHIANTPSDLRVCPYPCPLTLFHKDMSGRMAAG